MFAGIAIPPKRSGLSDPNEKDLPAIGAGGGFRVPESTEPVTKKYLGAASCATGRQPCDDLPKTSAIEVKNQLIQLLVIITCDEFETVAVRFSG
jgi:hypothetical protein